MYSHFWEIKRKNLGSSKREVISHKGSSATLPAAFSSETLKARRQWVDTLKNGKIEKPKPKTLSTKNPISGKIAPY